MSSPDVPATPPPTLPGLSWSGLTDVGRYRKNNEDTFLALTFNGHDVRYLGKTGEAAFGGSDFLFAVSDGMGGAQSGEFASRITIDRVTRLLPRGFRLAASGLDSGFQDILTELFSAVHADLIKLGRSYEECAGMGCTLSLAWFTPEWMYFGHIGDSRIYYLPPGGPLTQLTHDHSYVGKLRREGKINERQQRSDPRRNALSQALGASNQFIEPQIGAIRHQPGERFLICSDGLVDGLWDRQIEEHLTTPTAPDVSTAQRLVADAVQSSGRDNTTAVVIEVGGSPRP
ncbi:MAG: serine/threonine-protein phosphatase [Verrucomicrobia bacterium]|nr:serine/threonine-protein phosphatase [Verrucomicrobiota bacterium]